MSNLLTITSDNRPGNPTNGNLFYETDTNRLLLYYDGWKAYGTTNVTQQEASDIAVAIYNQAAFNNAVALTKTGDVTINTEMGLEKFIVRNDDTKTNAVFGQSTLFAYTEPRKETQEIVTESLDTSLSGGEIDVTGTPDIVTSSNSIDSANGLAAFLFVGLENMDDKYYLYGNRSDGIAQDLPVNTSEIQEYPSLTVTHGVTMDEYFNNPDTTDGVLVTDLDIENNKLPFAGFTSATSSVINGGTRTYNLKNLPNDATMCYNLSGEKLPEGDDGATRFNTGMFYNSDHELGGSSHKINGMTFNMRFMLNPDEPDSPATYRHILGYSNIFWKFERWTTQDGNEGKYYLATTSSSMHGGVAITDSNGTVDLTSTYSGDEGVFFEIGQKYNLSLVWDNNDLDIDAGTGNAKLYVFVDGVKVHSFTGPTGQSLNDYYYRDIGGVINNPDQINPSAGYAGIRAKISHWSIFNKTWSDAEIQQAHSLNLMYSRMEQDATLSTVLTRTVETDIKSGNNWMMGDADVDNLARRNISPPGRTLFSGVGAKDRSLYHFNQPNSKTHRSAVPGALYADDYNFDPDDLFTVFSA